MLSVKELTVERWMELFRNGSRIPGIIVDNKPTDNHDASTNGQHAADLTLIAQRPAMQIVAPQIEDLEPEMEQYLLPIAA